VDEKLMHRDIVPEDYDDEDDDMMRMMWISVLRK